jgi:hypothetical protein
MAMVETSKRLLLSMFSMIGLCVGLKIYFFQANWIAGFAGLNLFP